MSGAIMLITNGINNYKKNESNKKRYGMDGT